MDLNMGGSESRLDECVLSQIEKLVSQTKKNPNQNIDAAFPKRRWQACRRGSGHNVLVMHELPSALHGVKSG
jgi:hypothetical protein